MPIQVESTLYSASGYFHFYASSDDGETWVSRDGGVDKTQFLYFGNRRYDGVDLIVYSDLDTGFYILHPGQLEWKLYPLLSVRRLYSATTLRIGQDTFIACVPNEYEERYTDTSALYFTSNRGATWEKRTPKHPDSLRTFANPAYHSRGRIFSSAKVAGKFSLYQSDDFGVTWQKNSIENLLDSGWSAEIHFIFSSFLVAKAGKSKANPRFYRSFDNGDTWLAMDSYVEPGEWGRRYTYDIENRIIIARWTYLNDTLTYISKMTTDSGRTWHDARADDGEDILWIGKRHTGPGFFSLLVKNGKWTNANLDTEFRKVGAPGYHGLDQPLLYLVYVNGRRLVAASNTYMAPLSYRYCTDTLYISDDGGANWHQQQIDLRLTGLQWIQGKSYVFAIALTENDKEVLVRTSDEGLTWKVVMPDSVRLDLTTITAISGDTIEIRTTYSGDFISFDGGTTWSEWSPRGTFHRGMLHDFIMIDSLHYRSRQSSDLGKSWEELGVLTVKLPIWQGSLFSFDSLLFNISYTLVQDSLGSYTPFSFVHRSSDGGLSWIDISSQFDHPRENTYMKSNGGVIYLLKDLDLNPYKSDFHPHLYSSSDGGINWKSTPTNIPGGNRLFFGQSKIYLSSVYGAYAHDKPTGGLVSHAGPQLLKLTIVPNPAADLIKVNFAVFETGTYNIYLSDLLGRRVMECLAKVDLPGDQSIELELRNIKSGPYILSISNDRYTNPKPLVIQK